MGHRGTVVAGIHHAENGGGANNRTSHRGGAGLDRAPRATADLGTGGHLWVGAGSVRPVISQEAGIHDAVFDRHVLSTGGAEGCPSGIGETGVSGRP